MAVGQDIADLGERWPSLKAMLEAQAVVEAAKAATSAPRIPQADIAWLPVIPDPAKILCIGLNYETHRQETGRAEAEYPAVFTRYPDSQLGHRGDIVRPQVSERLDYEGELAVIIGKPGRYISEADAMDHIAGYSCYNDGSVRDWQRHTHQFAPGKNFPLTGAFGPWLVTTDEVGDPARLTITTRVNEAVVQQAGIDQMIFPIARLIAYCSSFTPLAPGDVIATGTPGGVGDKRVPPLYLQPGDRVEVEIGGVGTLINGVTGE
jgi:2-keto-4-pentenoate hydratase/2-oxohepta-3-ene-1,7-dioic acid hydratase in catechol pathway